MSSSSLKRLMMRWNATKPQPPSRPLLRETLADRVASTLNANQVRTILNSGMVIHANTLRAIERRAANLPSLQSYMTVYHRKKNREAVNRRNKRIRILNNNNNKNKK